MEQSDDETIDDVTMSILQLFHLLSVKDDSFHICCFLCAIKQEIAYELEKCDVSGNWDEVIKTARQVEVAICKYNNTSLPCTRSCSSDLTSSHSSIKSNNSSKSLTKGVFNTESIRSTLDELVSSMRALKINLVDQPQSCKHQEPFRCFQVWQGRT